MRSGPAHDDYFTSNLYLGVGWGFGGFGQIGGPGIPMWYSGKLLFQGAAFNGNDIELSTPTIIDIN